jgi:hypothetical protein
LFLFLKLSFFILFPIKNMKTIMVLMFTIVSDRDKTGRDGTVAAAQPSPVLPARRHQCSVRQIGAAAGEMTLVHTAEADDARSLFLARLSAASGTGSGKRRLWLVAQDNTPYDIAVAVDWIGSQKSHEKRLDLLSDRIKGAGSAALAAIFCFKFRIYGKTFILFYFFTERAHMQSQQELPVEFRHSLGTSTSPRSESWRYR